jgi:CRISPR-associated protein Cas7/Cse4/CasC, subtype I-E/ECOLI
MKATDRVYVDVHVLQTVPPSCINRDDTGSPKTAVYGGVTRARVSSQSWKHAVRNTFKDMFDDDELAKRTKKVAAMVANEIEKIDSDADAGDLASKICEAAGFKMKGSGKDDNKVKQLDALFFMSNAQARALAHLAVEDPDIFKGGKEAKEKLHNALADNPGIEIALFGRMVADDPTLNTDACAQVAHCISTHKVETQYDYFTAVDDMTADDNSGAAHLGTVEYDSATLYRYATIAVHQLYSYLDDDTPEATAKFVDAFVKSMPTGKQNTFANRTLPDAVIVTIRNDQPVNMAGAFEKAIFAGSNGYAEPSAKRLTEYAEETYNDFAAPPMLTFATGKILPDEIETMNFNELIGNLQSELSEILAEE